MKCFYLKNSILESVYYSLNITNYSFDSIEDTIQFVPPTDIQCGLLNYINPRLIIEAYSKIDEQIQNESDCAIFLEYNLNSEDISAFVSVLKKIGIRCHLFVFIFISGEKYWPGFLRTIENIDWYDTVYFLDIHDVFEISCDKKEHLESIEFLKEYLKEILYEALDMAQSCPKILNHNSIYLFNSEYHRYELTRLNTNEILRDIKYQSSIIEHVQIQDGKKLCGKLKKLRKHYAKEHNKSFTSHICYYKGACQGTCFFCEQETIQLYDLDHKENSFHQPDTSITAPIRGIVRLRNQVDGKGIRSLVVFNDCFMTCQYCLNHDYINKLPLVRKTDVELLEQHIHKDRLYFEMTSGGLTFGGGEPLLYPEFIQEFHRAYPSISLDVETSLNVDSYAVEALLDVIDCWHVDIKDLNPEIYFQYTNCTNEQVLKNLIRLSKISNIDQVHLRVPHIPGFNTPGDVTHSINYLKSMGFTNIEEFTYIKK